MKKITTLILLITSITLMAQAPQGFNYQATVRNAAGQLILNQAVLFKFSLMQNTSTGTIVYSETHTITTDGLGGASLVIGTGTPISGNFSSINWGNGNYFMGIELNTDSGFVAMGTTQLLSVPYALYALNSNTTKKTAIVLTGSITDAEAAARIALEAGPNTTSIFILETTVLTSVDLSSLTNLIDLRITNNTSLTTVNFNGLTGLYDNTAIINNPSLRSLSFPLCKYIYGESDFQDNNSLITISFPVVTTIQYSNFESNPELSTIDLPALKKIEDLSISSNNKLTSVNLPSLVNSAELNIGNNIALSSISMPVLTTGTYLNISRNKLPSSQINTILHQLLTVVPASEKYIYLDNQTPAAPPTGQGIIDKNTLITGGNTVNTD